MAARREAAGRIHDGIPGARVEWDRLDATVKSFEQHGAIAADVSVLEAERTAKQRKAVKLASVTEWQTNMRAADKMAKLRGAKVQKIITDLARESEELMKSHLEVRTNAALIIGRGPDSSDQSITIKNMIMRRLVLAGLPIPRVEMDYSTPTIDEVAANAASSVVSEANMHALRIIKENQP